MVQAKLERAGGAQTHVRKNMRFAMFTCVRKAFFSFPYHQRWEAMVIMNMLTRIPRRCGAMNLWRDFPNPTQTGNSTQTSLRSSHYMVRHFINSESGWAIRSAREAISISQTETRTKWSNLTTTQKVPKTYTTR